jgi:hypothetical protein
MVQPMQKLTRKNAIKTRGRPFEKGNSGRPKGSRNRTTLALEAILDGEAEALTRKAIELALNGDLQALRICLDRLLPPRRERPVRFTLPPINAGADASKATAALISAVAQGELSPGEAASLVQMVEAHTRVLLISDFEQRLVKLEAEGK